jgi:hypothetical protein
MLSWLKAFWPFPWPWKPEDIPEPTHPILLVPGICGTQLGVRKTGSKANEIHEGKLVWVRVEHAVCLCVCCNDVVFCVSLARVQKFAFELESRNRCKILVEPCDD